MSKTLYIISGCNGSGKSTAARTLLPQIWQCREFVNADDIAKGLSPYNYENPEVTVHAGRIMIQRIHTLLGGEESFAVETTLASRSYVHIIEEAHKMGFRVSLLYFWLSSPELARLRVSQRVAEGGHNISDEVIARRYRLGLDNLFHLFLPVADEWVIYDNSITPRICIAQGSRGSMIDILDADRFQNLREFLDSDPSSSPPLSRFLNHG